MSKQTDEPTFEASVKRLEALIDSMESGEVPLEDLVTQFAEGSQLLKKCQEMIKAAELKIEQIETSSDRTTPFELTNEE